MQHGCLLALIALAAPSGKRSFQAEGIGKERTVEADKTTEAPPIIYGTAWKKDKTTEFVAEALRQGFRAIDTANFPKHYDEALVGTALQEALSSSAARPLARKDLWIQTKFTPNACEGQPREVHPYNSSDPVPARVRASIQGSLDHLGLTYLDSLLLHAPMPQRTETLEAWRELERTRDGGIAREIGVSNFNAVELRWLLSEARIKPAFVQNRCLHKDGWDKAVRELCNEHGVRYQGFWLLTGNRFVSGSELVRKMAKRYGSTPEQVLFSFVTRGLGILALSGTKNPQHMREDLAVASGGLVLTADEIAELRVLELPKHTSNDPVKATFHSELQEDAEVFWVNPDSQALVHLGRLSAGESFEVNSYHSHEVAMQLRNGQIAFRWKADRERGHVQSTKVSLAITVEFKNVGKLPLQVFWQSPTGEEVFQGDLNVEASYQINTVLDHRFVIRSVADSAIIAEWVAAAASAGTQHVEVGAPTGATFEL